MQNLFYYSLISLSTVIAVWDFAYYKIPNKLLMIMFALYIIFAVYMYHYHNPVLSWFNLSATVICFIIGLVLFYFNLLGAGDAKYLCIAMLWLNAENIVSFLTVTALAGGAIAVIFLNFEAYWQKSRIFIARLINSHTEIDMPARMVPYGMAISTGLIYTIISKKLS